MLQSQWFRSPFLFPSPFAHSRRARRVLASRRRRRRRRRPAAALESLEDRTLLAAPHPFDLATLDGENGFRLDGMDEGDNSGFSVAVAGDVNGDGFDDLIVGAPYASSPELATGEAYVVFGRGSGVAEVLDLATLDGSNGFKLFGDDSGDWSGYRVNAAGDVNGDGFDDVIVGAPAADPPGASRTGESYLVFGAPGAFPPSLDLSSLDGTNGIRLLGVRVNSFLGGFVSTAGDVNGDGFDDIIMGASNNFGAGESYVVFGASDGFPASLDLSLLNGTDGFTLVGIDSGDGARIVSGAGDVNGDGFDDLIIGAPGADQGENDSVGESYVVFGAADGFPARFDLASLDGTNGFRLDGINDGDVSGAAVSSAGDLNGDGLDDLIIGAWQADPGGDIRAGQSYVVFGSASEFPSALQLSSLNGTDGFRLDGIDMFDSSGFSVGGGGDLNGDGFDDLITGASGADPNGESYVIFGASGGFATVMDLSTLDGTNGFRLDGVDAHDRAGHSVSMGGDVNGDGFDDLIIGARSADVDGNEDAGESYVIFGGNFSGGAETQVGGDGPDTLTATMGAGVDILVGGQGNDTLISDGGDDVLRGGEGDDVLAIPDANFSPRRLQGGNGFDTLRLDGAGITLDLTAIADNRITDVEAIDFTGSGDNKLLLDRLEVLNLSTHSNTLVVRGDAGDLIGIGGGWTTQADEMIDDVTFAVFTQGAAVLKIQAEVGVISTDVIFVNDDFTQAAGTLLADADPNTIGDQPAIIGANAFASIQDGLNAVEVDGTINITDDLSSDGSGQYVENPITAKNVTIRSTEGDPTAVVVDGGAAGSVFSIDGATVTFESLTIQNGAADNGGGVVNEGGIVFVNDSIVQNNAAAVNGGGIHASAGAKTYVDNSLVDGNSAGEEGGGLWSSSDGLLIVRNGSVISGNRASADAVDQGGGGIFNDGGRLALLNATVSGNTAGGAAGSGGGIFSVNGAVTLDDTTVSGNTANRAGGGIEYVTGTVRLTNSHLVDNVAGPAGTANPGRGGGLHVSGQGGRVTITGGTVSGNTAGAEGGGLWNQNGNRLIIGGGTVIGGNTASGNAADEGGGGIFNDAGRLAIHSGVTISNNMANGLRGSGGGVFVGNGTVTIDDSFVIGNTANRAGGGIEVVTGLVQLTNVQLDDNVAGPAGAANPGSGGGLHVSGRPGEVAHITLFGGTVSGNTAALEGGGIWNQGPTVMVIRDGTVIDGNTASGDAGDDGGGGIFHNSGRLAILGSTISNNTADGTAGSGGGLYVVRGGVTIEGESAITGNSANRAGGGIEIVTGEVILVDSTLSGNDAGVTGTANPGNGGGLHVTGADGGRIDLRNTLVTGNRAALDGGGLWHQTDNVMLVRADSQLTGNTASGDAADDGGGGIFNNGGRLVLNSATIDDNTADGISGSGGGLLLAGGVTTIEDSTISGNTANRAGGGIEIVSGLLLTVDMILIDNVAGPAGTANPGSGGGLHITGTTQVRATIEGGEISGNTAAQSGGGLWHAVGSILVITDGTTVSENTASGDAADDGGGGIFNNGGRVAITGASLWGNTADGTDGSGGGIHSLGGAVTLDNSTVSGNTANGDGGGIANYAVLIATNATIADNRGDADGTGDGFGGGVLNRDLATLNNSIVAGNIVGTGTTLSDLAGETVRSNSANNLVSDALSAGGLSNGMNGNIVGKGGSGFLPLGSILSPLADNGGPTMTHALVSGSLAIDGGNNGAATDIYGVPFRYDQRGDGFQRIKNGIVDIGAIEA